MRNTLLTIRSAIAARQPIPIAPDGARPAAVLVPLVLRNGEPHLVFTLRHADLREHAGQISFPGGKTEHGDADPVATALREAEEELGLVAGGAEILGILDDVATPTGFVITPVVAHVVPAPAAWAPNAVEVAEVFELPVARLLAPAAFQDRGDLEFRGHVYRVHAYCVDDRVIWGATGRIVKQLLALLG